MLPLDPRLGKVGAWSLEYGCADLGYLDAGARIGSQVFEPRVNHRCKSVFETLVRQPFGKARGGRSV